MADEVDLDQRGRRRAMNEAVFRDVNERMTSMNETFSDITDEFSIVCECDDVACIEQLSVQRTDYEAIRSDPTLFAVAPGHDSPAVETIVDERPAYTVVRKRPGEPERIAIETDPRSP